MAIPLTRPQPNPPKTGREFKITAIGTPPYEFTWIIDGVVMREPEQEEATLTITVPSGKTGETLYIKVEDDNGEEGTWSDIIGGATSGGVVGKEH